MKVELFTAVATENGRVVHYAEPRPPGRHLKAGHEVAPRLALCGVVGKRIHVRRADPRRSCVRCRTIAEGRK